MATVRVGSVTPRFVTTLSASPSAVPPQKMSLETYTVNGLTVDMLPVVNQQQLDSNLLRAIDARVTSANTLEICWINLAGGNTTVSCSAGQAIGLVCF